MSATTPGGATSAGAPVGGPSYDPNEGRSIGELLSRVTTDMSELVRQEIALAKAEATESGKRAGKAAGMFSGAAVAGHLFLVFLSVAVWWGLGNAIGRGWSGLVVALVWAIVAGVLALSGKKKMEQVKGLPRTGETLKKVPPAAKGHEEQNR
jgi:uncharacterized membrane protein YqjE